MSHNHDTPLYVTIEENPDSSACNISQGKSCRDTLSLFKDYLVKLISEWMRGEMMAAGVATGWHSHACHSANDNPAKEVFGAAGTGAAIINRNRPVYAGF